MSGASAQTGHTPPLSAEELAKLIDRATDSDLIEDGRYFRESRRDLTQCYHGDGGRFLDEEDGKLVVFLWNNRHRLVNALRAADAAPDLLAAARAATDILESYVEFLHRLPADDLECHPYIPTVEEAFDKVRDAISKAEASHD